MRNIRAIVAFGVFVASAIAITSCSDMVEKSMDNALFDANNNHHVSVLVGHAVNKVELANQNIYTYSYFFEEGKEGVTVNIVWDEGTTFKTDAEGNREEIHVPAGSTNVFFHNEDLEEILN